MDLPFFSVFKYKGWICLSFWLLKIIAKGLLTAGRLVLCLIMASGRTNQPPVYTLKQFHKFNNNFCFTKLLEIKWHASLYYVISVCKIKITKYVLSVLARQLSIMFSQTFRCHNYFRIEKGISKGGETYRPKHFLNIQNYFTKKDLLFSISERFRY